MSLRERIHAVEDNSEGAFPSGPVQADRYFFFGALSVRSHRPTPASASPTHPMGMNATQPFPDI
jgi:hypothetical protein